MSEMATLTDALPLSAATVYANAEVRLPPYCTMDTPDCLTLVLRRSRRRGTRTDSSAASVIPRGLLGSPPGRLRPPSGLGPIAHCVRPAVLLSLE